MRRKFPKPGTGVVGSGCAVLLVGLIGLPVVFLSFDASAEAFAWLGGIALIAGLLAAHFGESVHETLLKIVAWFG